MEKISAELEQEVIKLIEQDKVVEAVALVQEGLKLGLKASKELVDRYR